MSAWISDFYHKKNTAMLCNKIRFWLLVQPLLAPCYVSGERGRALLC